MKAIVKKMELNKIMNRYYLKITMESQKKEYIVSNSKQIKKTRKI